jgi:hypothetical protein
MNIVLIVVVAIISIAFCSAICVLIYKAYEKYTKDPKREVAVRPHTPESIVAVQPVEEGTASV